ncbi:hypothetical protein [Paraburkholderia mimosarum]|uniref:hypothetical protein n=1 Tax=Paraburkholderia mimosarum TaxID=312026 RepID=UPI001FC8B3D9|nr:hypothetical protein [Paraburkholderia mimosarum]
MEHDVGPMLIEMYDGQFFGEMSSLTKRCVVEGGVTPYDREPFSTLEEAWRLLEMCAEKYATPPPRGDCFTVFIGRKERGGEEVEPLVRLDLYAHNGEATACVMSGTPSWNTERVRYQPEDSAVTIVLNVLRGNMHGE